MSCLTLLITKTHPMNFLFSPFSPYLLVLCVVGALSESWGWFVNCVLKLPKGFEEFLLLMPKWNLAELMALILKLKAPFYE